MLIIKKLRLQNGWSQSDLAQFSGLSIRTVQRIEKGDKPSLESLKSLAAVFDIDIAELEQRVKVMDNSDVSKEEENAFKYVQDLKGFYAHLTTYVIVIIGLCIINFFTSPHYIWVRWPALGWGIGILSHGLRTFRLFNFLGPDWEKKQVEKKLGRKL